MRIDSQAVYIVHRQQTVNYLEKVNRGQALRVAYGVLCIVSCFVEVLFVVEVRCVHQPQMKDR